MKPSKEQSRKSGRAAARPELPVVEPRRAVYWPYALGLAIALAVAFEVYAPSLNGPFLFDDQFLPFGRPDFPFDSLRAWISGVRPLLMFTYWINYQLSGPQTFSYHAFNVLFHGMVSILVFFVVRKILEWAQVDGVRRDVLAVFAGALFLLHPVNSESVGYVASRSENLSVLFFLGAFALFLYRRSAEITWTRTALVLIGIRRRRSVEGTYRCPDGIASAHGLFLESAILFRGNPPELEVVPTGYDRRSAGGGVSGAPVARRNVRRF